MLYLGNVLLRYVLIYNLEVSFNFHLTFLQLNVIKMFTVQLKLFFFLLPATFFELPITRIPDNSNFFRFPLKVRVIGSRLHCEHTLFFLSVHARNCGTVLVPKYKIDLLPRPQYLGDEVSAGSLCTYVFSCSETINYFVFPTTLTTQNGVFHMAKCSKYTNKYRSGTRGVNTTAFWAGI